MHLTQLVKQGSIDYVFMTKTFLLFIFWVLKSNIQLKVVIGLLSIKMTNHIWQILQNMDSLLVMVFKMLLLRLRTSSPIFFIFIVLGKNLVPPLGWHPHVRNLRSVTPWVCLNVMPIYFKPLTGHLKMEVSEHDTPASALLQICKIYEKKCRQGRCDVCFIFVHNVFQV